MRAALLLLTACGFSVGGPSHAPRAGGPPPECTSSAPGRLLLDLGGIVVSAMIANFAYKAEFAHEEDTNHPGKAAPWIAVGVIYAGGIVVNMVQTSRCSRAKAEHARLNPAPR